MSTTPHIFPLSAQQAIDVSLLLAGLTKADQPNGLEEPDGMPWGGGCRAVLGVNRIPVHTDALGATELLGWAERGDFEWGFTQIAAPEATK